MANNKLNTDGILLLEQPFVRVRVHLHSVSSTLLRPCISIRLDIGSLRKLPQDLPYIPAKRGEGLWPAPECVQ